MLKEFINRPPILDFWKNIDTITNQVSASGETLTMIVHPTWQSPAVKYTSRYYKELQKVSGYEGPKVLMYENLDDMTLDALPKTEMYGIQTVTDSDAKPKIGWQPLLSALRKISPKSINMVGQNINFWFNVPEESITDEVHDFNSRNRELLNSLGARDMIVYPVQCLGSLWMLLNRELPEIQINLTKSVHPLLFIDFGDRGNYYHADFNKLKD